MTCPKCDGQIDAYIRKQWGDGEQKHRYAPMICSWCASLMLIDLKTDTLISPDEVKEKTGHDVITILQSNKAAWEAIEAHRKLILGTPNRRPVLR